MNTLAIENETVFLASKAPGWLLLSIDERRFAIPKKDIKTISLASSMDIENHSKPEVGKLKYDDHLWSAYNLDAEMALSIHMPQSRRFCIVLSAQEKLLGLVCDEITMLPEDDDLDLQTVSNFALQANSPLKWVSVFDKQIVPAAKTGCLVQYLTELERMYVSD